MARIIEIQQWHFVQLARMVNVTTIQHPVECGLTVNKLAARATLIEQLKYLYFHILNTSYVF